MEVYLLIRIAEVTFPPAQEWSLRPMPPAPGRAFPVSKSTPCFLLIVLLVFSYMGLRGVLPES